jgi:hypothetical protein
LSFLIQPWPPQDFGLLVDSQTDAGTGIQKEAFVLYSTAIFNKDVSINGRFVPKVCSII